MRTYGNSHSRIKQEFFYVQQSPALAAMRQVEVRTAVFQPDLDFLWRELWIEREQQSDASTDDRGRHRSAALFYIGGL